MQLPTQSVPRTRTRNLASSSSPVAPPSPAWSRVIKQFDFYPKADADVVQKRSKWGGGMTIACAVVLLYLVVSEVINYVAPPTVDVLTVDTRRETTLAINMDIKFPRMSCLDVVIDVVEETSGETLQDATHQIIKQRIDKNGVYFSPEAELSQLGKAAVKAKLSKCEPCVSNNVPAHLRERRPPRPGLGAKDHKDSCCLTCEEVRDYLRVNNIPQQAADYSPQCRIVAPHQDKEGCHIRGFLEVPRGKGEFHMALGKAFSQNHDTHVHHVHQIDPFRIDHFNVTHIVNSLSFGPPMPSMVNPLDKHKILATTLAQHIYMIQVIPTTYDSGSSLLHTNQYSFTEHHRRIYKGPNFELPGVFFKYDINPLMIHIHAKGPGFANFLTRLCAIIGGLYVVFGIVYSLTSTVVKTTKKTKL